MDMYTFSIIIGVLFDPLPLLVLGLIIALFFWIKKSHKQAYFFASVHIAAGILITALKELFAKPRPVNMLIQETTYAFPSGHATISTVFFGSIAYLLFRNKPHKTKMLATLIVAIIIILTSITRIYLQVHDSYDILAGMLLGGIILFTATRIYKKV